MTRRLLIDEDTLTIVLDALDFAGAVLAELPEDCDRYETLVDRLRDEMSEAPFIDDDGKLIQVFKKEIRK